MALRCLIVDTLHENFAPLFHNIGVEFDYEPNITRSEIIDRIGNYDGLIIRSKTKVDEGLVAHSNLKFIARAGAGIDNLDESFLKKQNIAIINAPEGNRDAVGEHTVGLILNLLHNINKGHNEIIDDQWLREPNRGWELGSKTVGIYGFGNAGSSVAEKLAGFGCNIIAYDKYQIVNHEKVSQTTLEVFFEQADIVSVHIPLTTETRGLFSFDYFNNFHKPIIFINTARGEIAPLHDMRAAIESGKINQAGLDVLECEKFSKMSPKQREDFDWLRDSGKLIFSPHVAGWTYESYARINVVLAEKIGAFLERKDFS